MQESIAIQEVKTIKKRKNSRSKGARGERAFRDLLREQGFDAIRGQQFKGGTDSPDVNCHSLPSLHFEVKVGAQIPVMIYDSVSQCVRDCGGKIPVTAMKRDYADWLIVMRAEDWFSMLKETEHVKTIFCPACKSSDVIKNGKDYKSRQKYRCMNKSCERDSF